MFGILTKIKYYLFKRKWMKQHPDTIPNNHFDPNMVTIGKRSYGELNVVSFNNKSRLVIGNFVSIAQKVTFILDADHLTNSVSTYPYNAKVLKKGDEAISKGDIIVDDDVWIGYGATILSGVHIGQGAVIAADALVNKDVEPYTLVGGVPAKKIKFRFEDSIRNYLLTLNYSGLTDKMIQEHADDLYTDIRNMHICEVQQKYSWFPKK